MTSTSTMNENKDNMKKNNSTEKDKEKGIFDQVLTYLLRHHNWIFVMALMPISVCYDIYCFLNFRISQIFFANKVGHEEGVMMVQKQVSDWSKAGSVRHMCSSRASWKSISLQKLGYKDVLHTVNLEHLKNVISLDEEQGIVRVEPMVTIGLLNDYLVKLGWTCTVVPEFDDITIGGLVMGGGLQTTSAKYGLFQSKCKGYEVVLADASVVWCDKDNHPELYHAIPWSYGTFGFLTALDIELIPYKPYVKHTYIPVQSLQESVDLIEKFSNDSSIDTVEGILYTREKGVVMKGVFVDESQVELKHINPIGRWYKPWFYTHAETFLSKSKDDSFTEYIPTVEYFHRHNKAYLWLMKHQLACANDQWFRYLFGWSMPIKFSLLKFLRMLIEGSAGNGPKDFVLQDIVFDIKDGLAAMKYLLDECEVFPVWLCPARKLMPREIQHLTDISAEDLHIDVGLFGHSPIKGFDKVEFQKRSEEYCLKVGGAVACYGETELTKEQYYKMFERDFMKHYDRVRNIYGCEIGFPHVYDKISKAGREGQ